MSKIKILQLNVWTGRMKGALPRFLRENDFDIVCMQEAVWSEQAPLHLAHFAETVDTLKAAGGFEYDLRQSNWGTRFLDGSAIMEQGNAILSRLPIASSENIWIHGDYSNEMKYGENWRAQVEGQGYGAIKAKFENGLTLLTHHGYWQPEPIGNEVTIECMQKVADALRDEKEKIVMCGDLNVVSESPAMRAFDGFLEDLTQANGVTNTLQYLKLDIDVPCDHILVSKDVRWSNFQVHEVMVSDHKALSVEIEI